MTFRIEPDKSSREGFDDYRYCIYDDGVLIAHYWHDFRGDDHGIEFVDGTGDTLPSYRMVEFLEGGGPKPLTLSARALEYLASRRVKRG